MEDEMTRAQVANLLRVFDVAAVGRSVLEDPLT